MPKTIEEKYPEDFAKAKEVHAKYLKGLITLSERYEMIARIGTKREGALFKLAEQIDDEKTALTFTEDEVPEIMIEWWHHIDTL